MNNIFLDGALFTMQELGFNSTPTPLPQVKRIIMHKRLQLQRLQFGLSDAKAANSTPQQKVVSIKTGKKGQRRETDNRLRLSQSR